jgi:hypothetical protein
MSKLAENQEISANSDLIKHSKLSEPCETELSNCFFNNNQNISILAKCSLSKSLATANGEKDENNIGPKENKSAIIHSNLDRLNKQIEATSNSKRSSFNVESLLAPSNSNTRIQRIPVVVDHFNNGNNSSNSSEFNDSSDTKSTGSSNNNSNASDIDEELEVDNKATWSMSSSVKKKAETNDGSRQSIAQLSFQNFSKPISVQPFLKSTTTDQNSIKIKAKGECNRRSQINKLSTDRKSNYLDGNENL